MSLRSRQFLLITNASVITLQCIVPLFNVTVFHFSYLSLLSDKGLLIKLRSFILDKLGSWEGTVFRLLLDKSSLETPHIYFYYQFIQYKLAIYKKILKKLLLKGQTNLLIADQLEATSEAKLSNWLWFATSSDNWGNFAVSKLARLIKLLLETSTMVNFVHWSTPGISRSPYKKRNWSFHLFLQQAWIEKKLQKLIV